MCVAKEYLGPKAEKCEVSFEEIKDFAACGLCGTAAPISPSWGIVDQGKEMAGPAMCESCEAVFALSFYGTISV